MRLPPRPRSRRLDDVATRAGPSEDWLEELRARVERSVASLNAGDPEPLLAGYDDDVVVVAPLGEAEDPETDFVLRGKAAYRRYLLTFLEFHRGFDVTGLAWEASKLVVSVVTRTAERKRLVVTLDEHGLGRQVTIFNVP